MVRLKSLSFLILLLSISFCANADLAQEGYIPWHWQASACANCALQIVPIVASDYNHDVYVFLNSLTSHKTELLELYKINGQDYNLLAWMAVGILGQESQFFRSERYKIKESVPLLITLAKKIKAFSEGDKNISANSRGPTQIKVVPKSIAEFYNIKASDLSDPEKSAIATMGFLIESLKELRTRIRVHNLDYISESNIVDYLPYIYFGASGRLTVRTATPETNIYVKEMKRNMSYFKVYEKSE
ncbi:MAG: hypothetical protein ABL930_09420 [Pseudobdellovibrio sp.]